MNVWNSGNPLAVYGFNPYQNTPFGIYDDKVNCASVFAILERDRRAKNKMAEVAEREDSSKFRKTVQETQVPNTKTADRLKQYSDHKPFFISDDSLKGLSVYNSTKLQDSYLQNYANYMNLNPVFGNLYPNRWFTLSQLILSKQIINATNSPPTYITKHSKINCNEEMSPSMIPDLNYFHPPTIGLPSQNSQYSNKLGTAKSSFPFDFKIKTVPSKSETYNSFYEKQNQFSTVSSSPKVGRSEIDLVCSKSECDLRKRLSSTNEDTFNSLELKSPQYVTNSVSGQKCLQVKDRKAHQCLYCGKMYSRKYGLKIHIRTHTGYKPLKCKVCGRPFGDPSNLNKHVRLHAEGETPYRCDFCGKVLVRRRDLERHIKSRHPSEEPIAQVGKCSPVACPPADPRLWRPATCL